jgi:hypothetical protein
MIYALACRVVVETQNRDFGARIMTLHTCFVVLLSKIKTEDLASEHVIVKPLEIYTRSTHLLLKQEDTPSSCRVSIE